MSNAAKVEAETFYLGERATEKASMLGRRDESCPPAARADLEERAPLDSDQLDVKENVTLSVKIQLVTKVFQHPSGHGALKCFSLNSYDVPANGRLKGPKCPTPAGI